MLTNGSVTPVGPVTSLGGSGIAIAGADPLSVTIGYDGTTLSVTITDTVTGASASQTYAVNIPALLAATDGYVGFTAGTSNPGTTLGVSTWTYTPATLPPPPTSLVALPVSGTNAVITWTETSPLAAGYDLQRTSPNTPNVYTTAATLGANVFSFIDTTLVPGWSYTYRIRARNAAGMFSPFSNLASVTEPIPPITPSGAHVTRASTTELDLAWNDNSNNEDGYRIFRRSGSGAYTLVASLLPNTTSYQDTGLSPGTPYDYHIQAYNVAGYADFSGLSTWTLASAPTNVAAAGGTLQSTVSWSASVGAASYNVYRGTAPGNETLLASGLTGTSYADSPPLPGTTYYYVVSAVDAVGPGPLSIEVSTTTAPPTPASLIATGGINQIAITWTAAPGAGWYNIYRGSTTGTEVLYQANVATTTFVDTGLTANTAYFYEVTAANSSGESVPSAEVTTTTAPPTPATLAATGGVNQIALTWTTVAGASGYNLYRGSASGSEALYQANVTATTFVDAGLAAGAKYYYWVTAINSGAESPASTETSATTAPPAPTGLTVVGGARQITLSWTAAPGARWYNVYRGSTTGSEVLYQANVASTTFVDGGLAPGAKYFYNVTAANSSGESAASAEAAGTVDVLPTAIPQSITLPDSGETPISLAGSGSANPPTMTFSIASLPASGQLLYNGAPVSLGQTFLGSSAGLVYDLPAVVLGSLGDSFTFTATDADGQVSAPATIALTTPAGSTGVARIGGTPGDDTISLGRSADGQFLVVTINGSVVSSTLPMSSISQVRVFGRSGNDAFDLSGWTGSASITGGGGLDSVVLNRNTNITLGNTKIAAGDGMSVNLAGITRAVLGNGTGNNTFNLSGWTGTGSITGGGGTDTVLLSRDTNFTLGNANISTADGMSVSLAGIAKATLTGGPGNNTFDVSGWSGSGTINGGGGIDTLNMAKNVNMALSNGRVTAADGLNLILSAMENASLTGGPGTINFYLSAWTGTGTITGGSGKNAVILTRDTNITLGNTNISTTDGMSMSLSGVTTAVLGGGPSNNTFDVSGWTGTGSITGGGGIDTVSSTKPVNQTLTNTRISAADGLSMTLSGIGAGNLTISGSAGLTLDTSAFAGPVVLIGGPGNDTLRGGAGSDILVGGAGNDILSGGGGRDLLIGGAGADSLAGGGGDDLLVGESTAYDPNLAALEAILAEWTSPDDYATRVAKLTNGGGLNGSYVLSGASLIDDLAINTLTGGTGTTAADPTNLDWFIANLLDVVTDPETGEQITRPPH